MPNTGAATAEGTFADIGAFEMVDGASSELDLSAGWVEGPSEASAGETVSLRWQVLNVGGRPVAGSWRNTLSLVSQAGQVVSLGDVVQTASVGVEGAVEGSASVVIPAVTEGDWQFQVQVNAYRDVFEGQSTQNNTRRSELPCTVSAPVFDVDSGVSDEAITPARPALYKMTIPAGQSLLLAGQANAPVSIVASAGFAPADNAFDWQASAYGDNQYALTIPEAAHERTVYVRVATTRPSATFSLFATVNPFSLDDVSTTEISNAGPSTLTVTGAGLKAGMTFALQQGAEAPIAAADVHIASGSSASVRFDMAGAATGVYTLSVTSEDSTRTQSLTDAVTVVAGVGESLEAWIEIPDAVREGRVYKGYAHYANTGDVDMLAPVLYVWSDTGVQFAASVEELDAAVDSLPLLGVSPTGPAGILKPGESGRVSFYFVAESDTNIKLLSLQGHDNPMEQDYWDTRLDYHRAMSQAATRLADRGSDGWGHKQCYDLAVRAAEGLPNAAISGYLRDATTGEPLVGMALRGVYGDGEDNAASLAITDRDGHFSFTDLPDGVELQLGSSDVFDLSEQSLTLGLTGDLNGIVLTASPYGTISGRVRSTDGVPLEGVLVTATASLDEEIGVVSDEDGNYVFKGLAYGTYTVSALGATREAVEVANGHAVVNVDFIGGNGRIEGLIREDSAQPVADMQVVATSADGDVVFALSDLDGRYVFENLPDGTWSIELVTTVHLSVPVVEVVTESGEAVALDFLVDDGASISGTVVDDMGAPVPGLQVLAIEADTGTQRTAVTDHDGAYVLRGLATGVHELSLWYPEAPDYGFAECEIVSADQELTGIDAVAPAASGSVVGIVSGEDATAIADATVFLFPYGTAADPYVAGTDAAGAFAVSTVVPGIYLLRVEAAGYVDYATVHEVSGASADPLSIALSPASELTGTVYLADGVSPVAGLEVALLQFGYLYQTTTSDTEGRFAFAGIPEGEFTCVSRMALP